jgi:hypothetical protein
MYRLSRWRTETDTITRQQLSLHPTNHKSPFHHQNVLGYWFVLLSSNVSIRQFKGLPSGRWSLFCRCQLWWTVLHDNVGLHNRPSFRLEMIERCHSWAVASHRSTIFHLVLCVSVNQGEWIILAGESNPGEISVPWYKDDPAEIPPQAREISKYSKTPSNEIVPHILRIKNVLTVSMFAC